MYPVPVDSLSYYADDFQPSDFVVEAVDGDSKGDAVGDAVDGNPVVGETVFIL